MGLFSGEWNDPMSWKVNIPALEYVRQGASWFISDGGKYLGVPVTFGGLGGDATRKDVDIATKTGDWKSVYTNLPKNFQHEFAYETGTVLSQVTNFGGDLLTGSFQKAFSEMAPSGLLFIGVVAVVGIIILKKI